jgi:GNAT superfamily N-acetyltransferase
MPTAEIPPTVETQQVRNASRTRLRRAPEVLRTEGPLILFAKLVGNLFYRRVVVVATDLTKPAPAVTSEVPLDIREVTAENDVRDYVACGPRANAETMKRRLAAGSRCFAAWNDGRSVSGGWADFGRANFDAIGAVVPLGPRDVYGRDAYTVPELRGRNIATVRMATAMQQLHEEGYERALGYVLPRNRRGFGPTTKSGVDPVGSLGWFGIGPLRIYFFTKTGAKTRFMPRFRRGAKPVSLEIDLA